MCFAAVSPPALDVPRTIDVAFALGKPRSEWTARSGAPMHGAWCDKVVHYALPFGGSVPPFFLLARSRRRLRPRSWTPRLGIVVVTLALGFPAGGLYELWSGSSTTTLDAI